MWSRKSKQKPVFRHVELLARLMDDPHFWRHAAHQNFEISPIPHYIRRLQQISLAYRESGSLSDPQHAQDFMEECIAASPPALLRAEIKNKDLPDDYVAITTNPLAKKLYLALQQAAEGNYAALDKIISHYKKYLIWNFMCGQTLISPEKTSIDALAKLYNAFREHLAHSNKPEFLIMYEFILNIRYSDLSHQTKEDGMEKQWQKVLSKCLDLMVSLLCDVVIDNPALFLGYFGKASNLALCLRQDSYGICFYDEAGKADVVMMNRLSRKAERHMIKFLQYTMMMAFSEKYADSIFKNINDIWEFLSILTQPKTEYSVSALQSSNNFVIDTFANLLIYHPEMLKMIGNSKHAAEIYMMLPGIEKSCKAVVAYYHAGKGMSDARYVAWRNDRNDPLGKLPKDVIKIIADETEKLMKKELNEPESPDVSDSDSEEQKSPRKG